MNLDPYCLIALFWVHCIYLYALIAPYPQNRNHCIPTNDHLSIDRFCLSPRWPLFRGSTVVINKISISANDIFTG